MTAFVLREVKDISEFFFKEKDFFDRGSLLDLNHLRDKEMVFFGLLLIPLNSASCSAPKQPLVRIESGLPPIGAKRHWC
jgi:hypothetical protein